MTDTNNAMNQFDSRAINTPVYESLNKLRTAYNKAKKNGQVSEKDYERRLGEQKSQAQELYTYLATWGLMRLRAEEMSRNAWENLEEVTLATRAKENQEGKREMLECFFQCLERVAKLKSGAIADANGMDTLNEMDSETYLGLTGIALAVAREFSFWADAIYADLKEGQLAAKKED